jgi:hypothetical protein
MNPEKGKQIKFDQPNTKTKRVTIPMGKTKKRKTKQRVVAILGWILPQTALGKHHDAERCKKRR